MNQSDRQLTIACKRAVRTNGQFGFCDRPDCKFAHSLDDHLLPLCFYGEYCYLKQCNFFHFGRESVNEFITRTQYVRPDLPPYRLTKKDVLKNTRPCANVQKVDGKFTRCETHRCAFAHSISSFNPRLCSRGNECTNEKCMCIHPNEAKHEFAERIQLSLPPFTPKKSRDNSRMVGTTVCKLVLQGKVCKRRECFFAHSKQDYKGPVKCRFDGSCRNQECKFLHPAFETVDEFCKRTNFELPQLQETNVNVRKVPQPRPLPQAQQNEPQEENRYFILHLDSDESSDSEDD